MNLNHLAAFDAVAREGGFTRGATALRVSQPAVSKQVRELEAWFGLELVDRSGRAFRLTGAGRTLAAYARRIFTLAEEAEHALEAIQGLRRGRLAIGASTTIGIYLMPPLMGLFRERWPAIELSLEIGNTEAIQQRLAEHSIQIGLTEGLAENPDLDVKVFMKDELVVIAPPGDPLARRRSIRMRDLRERPFIFRERGSGTRVVIEHALERKRIRIQPVMSLGSTEAIKRAVGARMGLGIVSRLTIEHELADRRLIVLPIADMKFPRPLHLLTRRNQTSSPSAQAFLDLLGENKMTNEYNPLQLMDTSE